MIARAGTCVTLSLVIVVVASVVLHRPDRVKTGLEVHSSVGAKHAAGEQPKAAPAIPKPREMAEASNQSPPKRLKAAFDRVGAGETLVDVARRVYGDGANLEAFWRVNRDQLASTESAVHPGMVLRTPEL